MRRYISLAFTVVLALAFIIIVTYEPKPSFHSSHQGTIKDIRYFDNGYMVYVDQVVLSKFGEATGLHLGDKVQISGKFQDVLSLENKGFGSYLKGRGTSYIVNSGTLSTLDSKTSPRFLFLNWLDRPLDKLYGEFSYFPKALLYGYTLDKSLLQNFRLSGTSHVLALSGFHIGFIILCLNLLLFPLGIRTRTLVMAAALICYAYMTGGRPSIVRSVAFFILYCLSFANSRPFDTLNSAILIATILIATNPFILYDAGFVLSFLCVASIFMFYPMLNRLGLKLLKTPPKALASYVYKLVLTTLSAQILALPYMTYTFGRISFLALPANLFILPLVSLLMIVIMLSLACYLFFPLAHILADLGVIIIHIILQINAYIANLSYASKEVHISPFIALGLTILLVSVYLAYENWRIQENKYE